MNSLSFSITPEHLKSLLISFALDNSLLKFSPSFDTGSTPIPALVQLTGIQPTDLHNCTGRLSSQGVIINFSYDSKTSILLLDIVSQPFWTTTYSINEGLQERISNCNVTK